MNGVGYHNISMSIIFGYKIFPFKPQAWYGPEGLVLERFFKAVAIFIFFTQANLVMATSPEDLIRDQRWYEALDELVQISKKELLGKDREEMVQRLRGFVEAEQRLDAAIILYDKGYFYGAMQCLKNIEPNFPKMEEVETLTEKAKISCQIQDAEYHFKMGDGEKSLNALKGIVDSKAEPLANKVKAVMACVEQAKNFELNFNYEQAKNQYRKLQGLISDPENEYLKAAIRFEKYLGEPDEYGIKVVSEGVRRWDEGDFLGAKQAFSTAIISSPALAYKKLQEVAVFAEGLYKKGQSLEATQPKEALENYKKAQSLSDINSPWGPNCKKKITELEENLQKGGE
jgi:tetratricopeptide (TPR) repeat protein